MEDDQDPQEKGPNGPDPETLAAPAGAAGAHPTSGEPPAVPPGGAPNTTTDADIRAEIEQRLGFFPPYLVAVQTQPEVLRSYWSWTRRDYLDLPLPDRFKEELQALLARFCAVSYAAVYHVTNLRGMGVSGPELLELLNIPFPTEEEELRPSLELLEASSALWTPWPEPLSPAERALLHTALYLFARPGRSARARQAVRSALGPEREACLTVFLAYVKTYHLWMETYPEPTIEAVPSVWQAFVQLLREEPRLAQRFCHYRDRLAERIGAGPPGAADDRVDTLERRTRRLSTELARATEMLRAEVPRRRRIERELQASRDRFLEVCRHSQDPVYTFDLSGRLTYLNPAAERLTGYATEEARELSLEQLVAPELSETAQRLLDPEACANGSIGYEIILVTRGGERVTLQAAQRLIRLDQEHAEFLVIACRLNGGGDSDRRAMAEAEAVDEEPPSPQVELQEELEARAQALREAELRAVELERTADELRAQLSVCARASEVRTAEIAGRIRREEELRSLLAEGERTIDALRTGQAERDRLLESLEEQLAAARSEADRAGLDSAAARTDLERIRAEMLEAGVELEQARAALAELAGTGTELERARGAAAETAAEIERIRAQLTETVAELGRTREVAAANGAALETARAELTGARNEAAALQGVLATERTEAQRAVQELRWRLENQESRRTELERELDEARRAAAEEASGLRAEIRDLCQANGSLRQELDRFRGSHATLQDALAQAEARAAALAEDRARAAERAATEARAAALAEAEARAGARAEAEARAADSSRADERAAALAREAESRDERLSVEAAGRFAAMMNLLRASRTQRETAAVLAQEIGPLFPRHSGALYLSWPGAQSPERICVWGGGEPGPPVVETDDCLALRRGCLHEVQPGRAALTCRHDAAPEAPGYVCIPLFGGGTITGVLHLAAPAAGRLAGDETAWAAAVAECVALVWSRERRPA